MARMQAVDEKSKTSTAAAARGSTRRRIPSEWLGKPDGPKAKLENEKPQGETIDYDELVKRWTETQSCRHRRRPPGDAPAAAAAPSDGPSTPMTLELRGVTKRIGAEIHIHETSLTLATEGLQRAARRDQRRQDHADQADGRPREADLRPRSSSTART